MESKQTIACVEVSQVEEFCFNEVQGHETAKQGQLELDYPMIECTFSQGLSILIVFAGLKSNFLLIASMQISIYISLQSQPSGQESSQGRTPMSEAQKKSKLGWLLGYFNNIVLDAVHLVTVDQESTFSPFFVRRKNFSVIPIKASIAEVQQSTIEQRGYYTENHLQPCFGTH